MSAQLIDDLEKHLSDMEILVTMIKHDVMNLRDGQKGASVSARKRLSMVSKLSTTLRTGCLEAVKKPKKEEVSILEPETKDAEMAPVEPEVKGDSYSPSESTRLNEPAVEEVPPQPVLVRQDGVTLADIQPATLTPVKEESKRPARVSKPRSAKSSYKKRCPRV
jgi:hypothetical protein